MKYFFDEVFLKTRLRSFVGPNCRFVLRQLQLVFKPKKFSKTKQQALYK